MPSDCPLWSLVTSVYGSFLQHGFTDKTNLTFQYSPYVVMYMKLQMFHIRCYQHVINADILSLTGLVPVPRHMGCCCKTTFGYTAWLADDVPAYQALRCQVEFSGSRPQPVPEMTLHNNF